MHVEHPRELLLFVGATGPDRQARPGVRMDRRFGVSRNEAGSLRAGRPDLGAGLLELDEAFDHAEHAYATVVDLDLVFASEVDRDRRARLDEEGSRRRIDHRVNLAARELEPMLLRIRREHAHPRSAVHVDATQAGDGDANA